MRTSAWSGETAPYIATASPVNVREAEAAGLLEKLKGKYLD